LVSPSPEAIKGQIARELVRVHEDSYGETAYNVEVVLHETLVAVVMDLELTPAEVTLIGSGYSDSVKESRETYQAAIGDTYIAIVERATGRRVTSFASRSVIEGDRPWAMELFRLEGRASDR
jgi:uncharacterized protein YbcI